MNPMLQIHTSFNQLRSTSKRVLRLVQRTVGGRDEINLRTSVNFDLVVDGLDWDSFLEEYEKEFGSGLNGLQYAEYFYEDSPKNLILAPIRLIWYFLLFIPASIIGIEKRRIPWYHEEKLLTVGDLVLSALAGRFVVRSQVRVIL